MTAADWRELFSEQVALAMVDGERAEADARRLAWQAMVERWLTLHPLATRAEAEGALRGLAAEAR